MPRNVTTLSSLGWLWRVRPVCQPTPVSSVNDGRGFACATTGVCAEVSRRRVRRGEGAEWAVGIFADGGCGFVGRSSTATFAIFAAFAPVRDAASRFVSRADSMERTLSDFVFVVFMVGGTGVVGMSAISLTATSCEAVCAVDAVDARAAL